jgi:hypothetical protein
MQNMCRGYLLNRLHNGCISDEIQTKLRHQKDKICPPEITRSGNMYLNFLL